MKRYFKLYLSFFKNCLIREMEFRTHFVLSNLISLSWASVFILTYIFIFRQTESVNGWTIEQILVLTSLYFLSDRVFDSFFEINFEDFIYMVNAGTLDFYLTKPVQSQFLVSLRRFSFSFLISFVAMAAVAVYLIKRYFWPLPLSNLFLFLIIFASGIIIVYSLWFMILLPVFWWGRASNIQHLFRPFHQLTRIPIDITGPILKPLFTFAIPLAFVATIPAQSLIGTLSPGLIVYGVFAATALLWLSHRLWLFSLKHYTSASS